MVILHDSLSEGHANAATLPVTTCWIEEKKFQSGTWRVIEGAT
jgi:hypothetical protein